MPSQEAPRSLRRSEWICNTFIRSLAKTNGEKTNVRTHDTASWNDRTKLMTVESHLPTQKATYDATTAQTRHRFQRGVCIADAISCSYTRRSRPKYCSRFDPSTWSKSVAHSRRSSTQDVEQAFQTTKLSRDDRPQIMIQPYNFNLLKCRYSASSLQGRIL